eukprot:2290194-Rhodomonas_salina.2
MSGTEAANCATRVLGYRGLKRMSPDGSWWDTRYQRRSVVHAPKSKRKHHTFLIQIVCRFCCVAFAVASQRARVFRGGSGFDARTGVGDMV